MKKLGDLYWQQLSMWDFSEKVNASAYSKDGFRYELHVVTQAQVNNGWKAKNLTWEELSDAGIDLDSLVPEKGHNWSRVMGNIYHPISGSLVVPSE